MLQKLQWDSFQQRRARSRVLMLYRIRTGFVGIPAAAYLEPVPSAPEGSKRDICWFSAIQAHTVRHFFQVQSCCGTLCPDSCQLQCTSWHFRNQAHQFSFHLSTELRPVLIACTAPFLSKVTVYFFAAWLSRYTSAYSLVVRYWSNSRRLRYRKKQKIFLTKTAINTVAARKCLTRHGVKPVRRPFCFW